MNLSLQPKSGRSSRSRWLRSERRKSRKSWICQGWRWWNWWLWSLIGLKVTWINLFTTFSTLLPPLFHCNGQSLFIFPLFFTCASSLPSKLFFILALFTLFFTTKIIQINFHSNFNFQRKSNKHLVPSTFNLLTFEDTFWTQYTEAVNLTKQTVINVSFRLKAK